MNKYKYINRLLFIFLCCTNIVFSQNNQLFKNATELYNEEQYERAIAVYNQILSTNQHSAALYFNKANAHYKQNQIAESIYYYEKALQLDPKNDDVLTNLAFANNMRIDKIDVIPEIGLSKLFSNSISLLSYNNWAVISVICMILFVLTFVIYKNAFHSSRKRLFFITSIIVLCGSLLSLFVAFQQEKNVKEVAYAIVFAEESQVTAEPKQASSEVFQLHEGTKIKVLENFNEYAKIKLTNGAVGWILAKDIKKL